MGIDWATCEMCNRTGRYGIGIEECDGCGSTFCKYCAEDFITKSNDDEREKCFYCDLEREKCSECDPHQKLIDWCLEKFNLKNKEESDDMIRKYYEKKKIKTI